MAPKKPTRKLPEGPRWVIARRCGHEPFEWEWLQSFDVEKERMRWAATPWLAIQYFGENGKPPVLEDMPKGWCFMVLEEAEEWCDLARANRESNGDK